MHQNLLHSITRRGVIHLGVNANLARHVNITIWVQVDMADAVSMTQHCDLCVLLDVSHQCIAATWDD